jgi:nicotinamide/nicotinate riboside kinase
MLTNIVMATAPPSSTRTLIIGLSGPSCSGKSTLARLLRSIFNIKLPGLTLSLFILHEDDFYKPDNQIPVR